MKTYYIQIERQGWTLAIVKVEADNYEQAQLKALKALHVNDDISEISEDEARSNVEDNVIDYVIDEDGSEIDLNEDATKVDAGAPYELYMQDESGFENSYKYDDVNKAIAEAIRIWDNEEGGYSVVAVYDAEGNRVWYVDHNMYNVK